MSDPLEKPISRVDAEELAIVTGDSLPQNPSPVVTLNAAPIAPAPSKRARLTPSQLAEAEQLYIAGYTPKQIAAQFNVTPNVISDHANHRKWSAKRAVLRNASSSLAERQTSQVVADARTRLVNGMTEIIGQGVEALRKTPPRGRKQVREHFIAAAHIIEVAKPVLGIGDQAGGKGRPINLTFLSAPGGFMRPIVEAETISSQDAASE